jgi:TRAP-type C4-dicarboxylate transport system substrate-binding protein
MNIASALWRTATAIFVLTFCGSCWPADAMGQTRLRLGTLLPRGTSQTLALEEMGQQWRVATGGAVTLTVYPGTMGGEKELVMRVRAGQLQAATLSVDGLSDIDPAVGAIQKIPMLYHSLEEMEYVRSKLQPELEHRLEERGFIVLCWADAGWVYIYSRQPYTKPSEFRDKKSKIFVTASDEREVELINNLGFQAVPLEWTDVFVSLQTGLVDTVPMTPFYAEASQIDTVAKNVLELKYVPLVGATVVARKVWESLTPDQREKMKKIAVDTGQKIQTNSRAESQAATEAMRKRSGLQLHPVPPDLEIEWRAFAESVYPKVRGKMVPADMFDKAVGLVNEYRTQKAGHP